MATFGYFSLIPSGISQVRSSLQSACEDAIFDLKNKGGSTFSIYKTDGRRVISVGYVEKKGSTYKLTIPGDKSVTLNRNGSVRKKPEPKPFLK